MLLTLSGQVNNFANLDLEKSGGAGAFSKDPGGFVLDFGSLLEGTGIATAFLLLENDIPVGEPGDLLDVAFNIGSGAFALQGFGSVQDLAPGQQVTGLEIAFDTTLLGPGLFDQLITLQGIGHNASGFSEDLGVFTLELHGRILERGSSVPEPSSFALLLLGVLGCGVLMRRRRLAR